MPAVHALISEPSGHDGKSLPELTETETFTLVKVTHGGCFVKNILYFQTLQRHHEDKAREEVCFEEAKF